MSAGCRPADPHVRFLAVAALYAQWGTCLRRNFGAVLVDAQNHVIGTGYTGAPVKAAHCVDLGVCWRLAHGIPSGQHYERCRSVHAEQNALLNAKAPTAGCRLYLAGRDAVTGAPVAMLPCFLCAKMLLNAGIAEIYVLDDSALGYQQHSVVDIWRIREKEAFGGG